MREVNPQAHARLVDVYIARQHGEWDRVFELLRRWAAYIDPSVLSYLRGSTWLEVGDPATASLFLGHASQLQPNNGNCLANLLIALKQSAPLEAQRRAEAIVGNPDSYAPVVVAHAADVVLDSARRLPEWEASQHVKRLILVLESALNKIEQADERNVDGSTYSTTCGLLGFCHEYLGENQAALDYYSKGLLTAPSNDGLLVARGILLYGESPRA